MAYVRASDFGATPAVAREEKQAATNALTPVVEKFKNFQAGLRNLNVRLKNLIDGNAAKSDIDNAVTNVSSLILTLAQIIKDNPDANVPMNLQKMASEDFNYGLKLIRIWEKMNTLGECGKKASSIYSLNPEAVQLGGNTPGDSAKKELDKARIQLERMLNQGPPSNKGQLNNYNSWIKYLKGRINQLEKYLRLSLTTFSGLSNVGALQAPGMVSFDKKLLERQSLPQLNIILMGLKKPGGPYQAKQAQIKLILEEIARRKGTQGPQVRPLPWRPRVKPLPSPPPPPAPWRLRVKPLPSPPPPPAPRPSVTPAPPSISLPPQYYEPQPTEQQEQPSYQQQPSAPYPDTMTPNEEFAPPDEYATETFSPDGEQSLPSEESLPSEGEPWKEDDYNDGFQGTPFNRKR